MRRLMKWLKRLSYSACCRYCGYSGGGWPDSGECPNCGEVN